MALVLWAVALGIETRRVRLAESSDPGSVDTLMMVGVGLGIAWLVVGACWSDQRTRNILRLEGHYPTRARAIRAWVFPAAWVALISFTVLKMEPNPDFDWRPMVVVAGFVITSWIPYQLIRRLFRSLVRVVPDAAILVLYVLDLIASGLLWWWFITWIDTDVATDASTLALLTSAAFAAAMALFVAAILVWYIDRAADRGQVLRERTIRTRHDHRVASAARARPARPGHALGAVPRPSGCRPRRGGARRSCARRASGAGAPGQALEVPTADHGAAGDRSGAACCSDQPAGGARAGTITATDADRCRPGSGPHSRPAAGHRSGRLSTAAGRAHIRHVTDAAGRAVRDLGHQTSIGGGARHVDRTQRRRLAVGRGADCSGPPAHHHRATRRAPRRRARRRWCRRLRGNRPRALRALPVGRSRRSTRRLRSRRRQR